MQSTDTQFYALSQHQYFRVLAVTFVIPLSQGMALVCGAMVAPQRKKVRGNSRVICCHIDINNTRPLGSTTSKEVWSYGHHP